MQLQFIKKWAKNKLNQRHLSEEDEENTNNNESIEASSKLYEKKQPKNPIAYLKRNAVFMSEIEINDEQNIKYYKTKLAQNEEIKSRIMIKLRDIALL